jgi:hypothetical protein
MSSSAAAALNPPSYVAAHRYDGAAVYHERAQALVPCAIQPRDVAIVRDIWRYKFLTAPQLIELWWPGSSDRAGQRRLRKLFDAGCVERFRPVVRRGSFPWTYQLGREGHRLLQGEGVIPARARYSARRIYDYGYVLHEIQLNAWVLAYRRALGDQLVSWEGETSIEPPPEARRAQLRFEGDWSAEQLREPRARLVRPDAVLEIDRDDGEQGTRRFFIEYDRTRRIDKNYEKFRRYDAFLNWWCRDTSFGEAAEPPFVIFVCQDRAQLEQFLAAADRELTGHRWHPSAPPEEHVYVGRRHLLFADELDVHAGVLDAMRVPAFPAGHAARLPHVRRVRIPGRVLREGYRANSAS